MSAKVFSAGSYWFCSRCRESGEVVEFADTARKDAEQHDKERLNDD